VLSLNYQYFGHSTTRPIYNIYDLTDSLNVDSNIVYIHKLMMLNYLDISTSQDSLSLQDDINKLTH